MTGPPIDPNDRVYSFGLFVADPAAGVLYHNRVPIALAQKSFELLIVLIERRNRVVKKDELLALVWANTFVEENNLARHVSTLRKTLGDHAHGSEYIKTIAGRGYSFVASVAEIHRENALGTVEPDVAAAPPPVKDPVRSHSWAPRVGAMILGALVVVVTASSVSRSLFRDPTASAMNRKLWQLSTGSGLDTDAAWSPDGQRIAYGSDRGGNFDIWLQGISDALPIRLTSSSEHDWQPAWRSDGQSIAFRSEREGGGIFVVSSAGGEARRLTPFGYEPQWSPRESKLLFYDSRIGSKLYVVNGDGTGLVRVLEDFLKNFRSFRAGWHPDGRLSIYGSHRTEGRSFWTTSMDGERTVRSEFSQSVVDQIANTGLVFTDFVWSSDGAKIYLEGRADDVMNVWRVEVDPKTLQWRNGPVPVTSGSSADTSITVSPDGTKLAFTARSERTRLWAFPFDPANGKLLGEGKAIAGPGVHADYPDVRRDGTEIVYRVSRQGNHELWKQSLADGANVRLVTGKELYTPRWSADGTTVAYRRPMHDGKSSVVSLVSTLTRRERLLTSASATYSCAQ